VPEGSRRQGDTPPSMAAPGRGGDGLPRAGCCQRGPGWAMPWSKERGLSRGQSRSHMRIWVSPDIRACHSDQVRTFSAGVGIDASPQIRTLGVRSSLKFDHALIRAASPRPPSLSVASMTAPGVRGSPMPGGSPPQPPPPPPMPPPPAVAGPPLLLVFDHGHHPVATAAVAAARAPISGAWPSHRRWPARLRRRLQAPLPWPSAGPRIERRPSSPPPLGCTC